MTRTEHQNKAPGSPRGAGWRVEDSWWLKRLWLTAKAEELGGDLDTPPPHPHPLQRRAVAEAVRDW